MTAATRVNRQWRLKSRPTGLIKADNFELVSQPVPAPEEGQVLIRSIYLSLDPAMRGWLIDRPSYVPPVQIGEIMRGLAIGIVEESNHPKFAAGDRVQGMLGWQEYLLSNGEAVTKLPESGLPFSAYLGLFGLAGLTAYGGKAVSCVVGFDHRVGDGPGRHGSKLGNKSVGGLEDGGP